MKRGGLTLIALALLLWVVTSTRFVVRLGLFELVIILALGALIVYTTLKKGGRRG